VENIHSVLLDKDSTRSDYILRFLNEIRVGLSGELSFSGSLGKKVIRKDGTIEGLWEK